MKRRTRALWRIRMRRALLILAACAVCAALIAGSILAAGLGSEDDEATIVVAPACHDGPTTAGIDVSYHQDRIDWKRVRWAGVAFAFVRISDGTTVIDTRFTDNWAGAKANGILLSLIHI